MDLAARLVSSKGTLKVNRTSKDLRAFTTGLSRALARRGQVPVWWVDADDENVWYLQSRPIQQRQQARPIPPQRQQATASARRPMAASSSPQGLGRPHSVPQRRQAATPRPGGGRLRRLSLGIVLALTFSLILVGLSMFLSSLLRGFAYSFLVSMVILIVLSYSIRMLGPLVVRAFRHSPEPAST